MKHTQPRCSLKLAHNLIPLANKEENSQSNKIIGLSSTTKSRKEIDQYESIAIKLGLMPKKVKKSDKNEKIQKNETNIAIKNKRTDASKQSSRKFASESKLSEYSRSNKITKEESEVLEFENPFNSLCLKLKKNGSEIGEKIEIDQLYKTYIEEEAIYKIGNEENCPFACSQSMIKSDETVLRLQVELNQLINKFSSK